MGGPPEGRTATDLWANARGIYPPGRRGLQPPRSARADLGPASPRRSPRFELATALQGRITDKQPRNWQRLAWYALEPLVALRPLPMVELDVRLQSSVLNQAIARRLAEKWTAQAYRSEVTAAFNALITRLPAATEPWQSATLRGLHEGLQSNRQPAPESWKQTQEQLSAGASNTQRELIYSISVQFGDTTDQEKLIAIVRDVSRSADDRLHALADCLARPNENVAALVQQMCYTANPQVSLRRDSGLRLLRH